MRFENKVAIITGAASGIGRAVALRLAEEGMRVVLGDINETGLAEIAATISGVASWSALDVSDATACDNFIDQAVAATGRLDVLCNIAGVLDCAPIAELTAQRWERTIAINLSGVFHMARAAMPHLGAHRGCVVNMASTAGLVGVPFHASYCASKHGVIGLTRALALEFANAGVRVNAVCPTGVKTPMIGVPPPVGVDWNLVVRSSASWLDGGEICDPEDIADAVAFLASDQARRITGIAFAVDGGQTAG